MFLSPRADVSDRSHWSEFWFKPVPSAGGMPNVTPYSALQLTAVFACVRVLAEGIASLPFTLSRVSESYAREPVTDHWVYALFAERPNAFQNPFEFREMLQGHLTLRGNAYCQIIGIHNSLPPTAPLHWSGRCPM